MRLPTSAWPRGGRPYHFRGEYYGDPIPGVQGRGEYWKAPPDAAWRLAAEGLACTSPQIMDEQALRLAFMIAAVDGLYEYQRHGAAFLAKADYAILGDEMGLGKTVQALCAAEARLHYGRVTGPAVLILCPALAKRHWAREVKRWTGHDAQILDGLKPNGYAVNGAPIGIYASSRYVIANYDILYGQRRRDEAGKLNASAHLPGWGKTLSAVGFPIVICDEAHNLRGATSLRTKAVKEVCANTTAVWLLSGTPMPNHVRDIWSLWDLCSGGLAGYYWPWCKAYAGAEKGAYGWSANGGSRLEELQKRLSFFVLQRSKAQVGLQLPPKRREIVTVDVDIKPEGPSFLVGSAENDPYGNPQPQYKKNAIANALAKTAAAKRPAVVEMTKDALAAGQKVVVFVYLREQAHAIYSDLRGAESGQIVVATGDQSPEQRDILAQTFRETQGAAAFVATIDSVGVAISLVGADLVIFADLSWEPAKLLQAEGRAHRHGSTVPVLVRYVIAAGTIDEDVAESVVDKLATIEQATGSTADATELAGGLALGRAVTTDAIIDRLYAKLTGG